MEKIVFADNWQKFFAEFGLKSFDDFFYYSRGNIINKNKKREVITLDLGEAAQKKEFFIKRFTRPYFKDMLFTWRNFGEPCSQARCEWENTKLLLRNNINTYKPVCYGERSICGIERNSFIVTEKLKGEALTDFVRQNWQQLNKQQKEKVITDIAVFIRRIHKSKISMPDLYVWHIFLKENPADGKWEFAVIDLHRMSHNVTNNKHQLKNLGRLLHSMTDSYFDEDLKKLFIKSYAGDDWSGDINTLIAQIKKCSDKVSAKRKPKPY